ncbi:MAG: hypothetical protein OTI36_09500 [Beijerinckiaceae bacterium]|nr:hypothetical protein [Beijerinckiaceae bacterium]
MSAEKGKMTPEDLAGFIYEKIIQENSVIYKDIYVGGYKNGATDPYMKRAFDFVSRLSEADRQTLLLMMRQVMVDTSSSLLAMFDGGADISPHTGRFEITYDDGRNLCGDLQAIFLELSEEDQSKRG